MATLIPYLTFNGNCREAMNYYQECLGGELSVIVAGESPEADRVPKEMHHLLLHSSLKSGTLEIMGTDMQPEKLNIGNDMNLCLVCKTEDEAHRLFEKLSVGGKVRQPLSQMFFGLLGSLTDRFGKHWLVECDKA